MHAKDVWADQDRLVKSGASLFAYSDSEGVGRGVYFWEHDHVRFLGRFVKLLDCEILAPTVGVVADLIQEHITKSMEEEDTPRTLGIIESITNPKSRARMIDQSVNAAIWNSIKAVEFQEDAGVWVTPGLKRSDNSNREIPPLALLPIINFDETEIWAALTYDNYARWSMFDKEFPKKG